MEHVRCLQIVVIKMPTTNDSMFSSSFIFMDLAQSLPSSTRPLLPSRLLDTIEDQPWVFSWKSTSSEKCYLASLWQAKKHFLNEFKNCWSQETTPVRFFFSHDHQIAYTVVINWVLSAAADSSKNRYAIRYSIISQNI